MSITNELFEFIKKSPTAFHTIHTVKSYLASAGFCELSEGECWSLSDGGLYFTVRGGTSIIAFRYNSKANGFMITASHSDSPAFRLKLNPEITGVYTKLDVEKYGGMIYYSWLDRPLSVAGRVVVRKGDKLRCELVNIDRDIAVIPSLAIHMNREVNSGMKFNPAKDLLPIVGSGEKSGELLSEIAESLGVSTSDIVSHDLSLYDREEGRTVGIGGEYILAPRLDDLECVFASTKAFLNAEASDAIPVLAVFDNEEVGSETKDGAASTFLPDVLSRISGDKIGRMLQNSFMVSADNAHGIHPNYPELSDANNAPKINEGIVIKWNSGRKYATDGVSSAVFSEIAKRSGAKTQTYYNRADMPGGSTLGTIANTKVSISTVDIGLPQLAMHSAVETAGAKDIEFLVDALTEFYKTSLVFNKDEILF